MKLKYCPNCASVNIGKNDVGMDFCRKCKYVGAMNEGAMDEINDFIKNLKEGSEPRFIQAAKFSQRKLRDDSPTPDMQKEKLKRLKGKSTENYEFL